LGYYDIVQNEEEPGAVLAVHRAAHATLHALGGRLAGLELAPSEINVLANLADGRRRTVGALAAATATRPTTLTSVLDRLTRRGWAARELDPADRRSFLVSLTPPGAAAARTVAAAVAELEAQALARVTPAQRAGFCAVVRVLAEGGL
jgi:MarR family transcriptional regulator, organic hydroperoxide resistance regulator